MDQEMPEQEMTLHSVQRTIELVASSEEVWEAICQPETWLADEGAVELRPGGSGRLVDDGVARRVAVDIVEAGSRVVFRWWDENEGEGDASQVEIIVLPSSGPTAVAVRETRLVPVARAAVAGRAVASRVALRWEVRLACLAFLRAPARV